jgi:hypothetical protein
MTLCVGPFGIGDIVYSSGRKGKNGFIGEVIRSTKWRNFPAYVVKKKVDGRKVTCLAKNLMLNREKITEDLINGDVAVTA